MSTDGMDEFGVTIDASDRTWCRIVHLSGVLDLGMLGAQEDDLLALVAGSPGSSAVIDLSGVSFCDSTGIGILVRAAKKLWEHDGSLRLAAAPSHISRVLTISGVTRSMPLYPTVDEACAAALA